MENKISKYIAASYTLYDVTDGKKEVIEQTVDKRPFDFLSGFGITIPAFEEALVNLNKGEHFDFTLTPDQAYGDHNPEHVLDLDKSIFSVNGKFDDEHIVVDAIIPLQNEDGNRFNGHVLAISEDKVKVDLNHPLAGKTLNFVGEIAENREATNEEISKFMNMLSGEGGCSGCGGGCGEGGCESGGEGCCGGSCGGGCHE